MSAKLLPDHPDEALSKLIEITRALLHLVAEENACIHAQDEAALQDVIARKEQVLPLYEQAAQEFKLRAGEFKDANIALLDELLSLQTELGAMARNNQFYLTS